MHEELFEKANLILEKYNDELTSKGIVCKLSRMELKTDPGLLFYGASTFLDELLEKHLQKREEKIRKNKRNKFFLFVLTFLPADKKIKINSPKNFAFIIKSVTRIAEGFEAKEKIFDEEKVLKKIEKCIVKILRKAESKSPKKICESSFCDNLRYLSLEKYSYLKTLFGKDRSVIEVGLILAFSLILIIFIIADIFIE